MVNTRFLWLFLVVDIAAVASGNEIRWAHPMDALPAAVEQPLPSEAVHSWRNRGFALVNNVLPLDSLNALIDDALSVFPHPNTEEASRLNDFGGGDMFVFPSPSSSAMNEVTLHPRLLAGVAQLLGVEVQDLRLSQSVVWPKYGPSEAGGNDDQPHPLDNQDQRIHMDYPNHNLLHPPVWSDADAVEIILYLSEISDCGGATGLVVREGSDDPAYQLLSASHRSLMQDALPTSPEGLNARETMRPPYDSGVRPPQLSGNPSGVRDGREAALDSDHRPPQFSGSLRSGLLSEERMASPNTDYGAGYIAMPGTAGIEWINNRAAAERVMAEKRPEFAELRQSLYDREMQARYTVGTVLFYRHDTWHRGTPLKPGSLRIVQNMTFKKRGRDWISVLHLGWAWAMYRRGRSLERMFAALSPEQRAVLGVPMPGDAYWTRQTIDAVLARYGYDHIDMQPYETALRKSNHDEL